MNETRRGMTRVLILTCFCLSVTRAWAQTSTVTYGPGQHVQNEGARIIVGDLRISGDYGRKRAPLYASYTLNAGYLSSSNTLVTFAVFTQNGGTNEVAETLRIYSMEAPWYHLTGGTLITSETLLEPVGSPHTFNHTFGRHITRRLTLNSRREPFTTFHHAIYTFEGGDLIVGDIELNGPVLFRYINGTLRHDGAITFAGGAWQSKAGSQELGIVTLTVTAMASNASLVLPVGSTSHLKFRRSAQRTWDSSALLSIINWAGALNGGGQHQVVFGDSSSGLTSQQVNQIYFVNPSGLPSGEYSATILGSGEVVPLAPTGRLPLIAFQKVGGHLRLEWPAGYILQSATNIVGRFNDAADLASPALVEINDADPIRFFRLRRNN